MSTTAAGTVTNDPMLTSDEAAVRLPDCQSNARHAARPSRRLRTRALKVPRGCLRYRHPDLETLVQRRFGPTSETGGAIVMARPLLPLGTSASFHTNRVRD